MLVPPDCISGGNIWTEDTFIGFENEDLSVGGPAGELSVWGRGDGVDSLGRM